MPGPAAIPSTLHAPGLSTCLETGTLVPQRPSESRLLYGPARPASWGIELEGWVPGVTDLYPPPQVHPPTDMGRRKSKRKPPPKKKMTGTLETQFTCPFCNHEKSCDVKM